jgi:hypothetical protein
VSDNIFTGEGCAPSRQVDSNNFTSGTGTDTQIPAKFVATPLPNSFHTVSGRDNKKREDYVYVSAIGYRY